MQITFTIPNDKKDRVTEAILGLHPNEDPDNFNTLQWAKEVIRRQIIEWVHIWEEREAFKAVTVDRDDTIIS